MPLFVRALLLVGASSLTACASSVVPVGATESAELTSFSRTFLVPVDARARTLCRSEVNAYYCDEASADAAASACLARIAAANQVSASDACATDDPRCFRRESYAEACAGASDPVYPDVASCMNPRSNNCSFYSACIEAQTPCGEQGYALGYGEKYCTAFKNLSSLSPAGEAWRDSVMHCLQEELVPFAASSSAATCDDVLDTAFASHPKCYTLPQHSICFLPPGDIAQVLATIGGPELFTARSRTQIMATIGTCLGQIASSIFSPGSTPAQRAALGEQYRVWQSIDGATARD